MGLFRTRPVENDVNEADLTIDPPENHAAGVKAVAVSMTRALEQMGPVRTAKTLLRINQTDGFDCQGCAWGDPAAGHRHTAEFCENGAKAVIDEATRLTVPTSFWAEHSLSDLDQYTDYWLGGQGRLVEPVVRRADSDHYEPISWDDAFDLIGEHLRALASPDEAIFYTSGKVSNEAAFAYQAMVRTYGTNNLPDCSNMCHESSGAALTETIGIGKGSVSLEDVETAELIIVAGQNPGTNHPRMLSALEKAKGNGAKIISINPLKEAGLVRFDNPQKPKGMVGIGTKLADLHVPVRLNGDLAFFSGIGKVLVERDALDHDFIATHTLGFNDWVAHLETVAWADLESASGVSETQIREAAEFFVNSERTVLCWAMGITQHRNAVATIREMVNVALAQGNIGKPGAGLCPVRGHSNVQGDRTMGIYEKPSEIFLDGLEKELDRPMPREHGLDTVAAIAALRDRKATVFMGLGGNFVSAAPDTEVVEQAMRNADLTVQVATKLNRSHIVTGKTALLLPPLGRSERDDTGVGDQRVTVEDSMSSVHASRGPLEPAGPKLKSEVDIVCSIAEATGLPGPWAEFREDYRNIRHSIARVVPGCDDFDAKVSKPGGFVLAHPPRDSRTFATPAAKAMITVNPIEVVEVPDGHLLLQSLRSHDQFNTTIYGLSDRYRGIEGGRRVIFVSPDDIEWLGLNDGDQVDLVAGHRVARDFRVVSYDTPRGCAAAYYPEVNPLVPLDSFAIGAGTPTSKSIVVKLEKRA